MTTKQSLIQSGLTPDKAQYWAKHLDGLPSVPAVRWQQAGAALLQAGEPFAVHRAVYQEIFSHANADAGPPAAWSPAPGDIATANITQLQQQLGLDSSEALHRWSVTNRNEFWARAIELVGVRFRQPYDAVVDAASGIETPRWLPGAEMNITDSCFAHAPEAPAIIFQGEDGPLQSWTVAELEALVNRVANGLAAMGLAAGDAIAVDMPMTAESVAIYLGIIKMGGVVVSIADSFAAGEIAVRVRIGEAKAIFTQDVIARAGKSLPLYQRVVDSDAPPAIVTATGAALAVDLRNGDCSWGDFLPDDDCFEAVASTPETPVNILFSSGTTGDPKAIPFTQSTPIKCAVDGYFHHDIHPGDVVSWPTNLGWMMGPWLIFASLMNGAAMALYNGIPSGASFGRFVQNAGVTMLGVIPSLVRTWHETACMEDSDWSKIRAFSSTGECSNAEDMLYLMWLAGYKPVIEYCGGTEIGGGYITGNVVRPGSPATMNTLALGIDAVILDDAGRPCSNGELFLVPPSIGLSNTLLNRDHHEVYFADTPTASDGGMLRRHGDQIEQLPGGYFRAHGRVDDTMNLGGIKTSSAEVERIVAEVDHVVETAAIAVTPAGGGPSQLVLYTVADSQVDISALQIAMQSAIRQHLNPLFKISDVVVIDKLPRTASNKVMRRVLRQQYIDRAGA
ncbi:MAG: AMP-binding protein [Lentisphaeria bacterium]|nr:AMP-binding protein [Lentisphaeria bacterium]MDP7739846.1 AMP-binding protein [Lentisphaeria bacterium]